MRPVAVVTVLPQGLRPGQDAPRALHLLEHILVDKVVVGRETRPPPRACRDHLGNNIGAGPLRVFRSIWRSCCDVEI